MNLGGGINTGANELGASLLEDDVTGTTILYFSSNTNLPGATGPCFGEPGPCFFDNYVTRRSKLGGQD